ncbi:BLUF domain-containing protein [Brevundimonas kwangchunensis]|uniref:BLUF domain-containing protein n=1 Tax=Brevundimonas kwangchunensis TaxID=322163 RepID=A0ABN1GV13_9CAUL
MSLNLQRIAYYSLASQPEAALIMLAEILGVSDRNNVRDSLTGALLVSRGRFFQVLEGAAQDLDRTLARIAADPRHHSLNVVLRVDVNRRMFGQWGMVAARIAPSQQPEIDAIIDRCHDDPAAAIKAARDLLEHQIAA